MRASFSVAVAALFFSAASYAQNTPRIEAELIGSFGGYQWTVPRAINNRGDVVGFVWPTGTLRNNAFLWTRGGGFELIAEDAVAIEINNRGDVIGYRFVCTPHPQGGDFCNRRGFAWNARTGFTDLGDFLPAAINNSGDMAGECVNARTAVAACAMHGGVLTVWECELQSCFQTATGINARGDVVGWRSSPDFDLAMFFPRRGSPLVFGSEPGPVYASDINNSGTIAGSALTNPSEGLPHATLWSKHGVVQALDAPFSSARALNERGWVAGNSGGIAAFFWEGSGNEVVNLAPHAVESVAYDINDRGEIVGTISLTDNVHQMVIWRVRP